MFSSIIPKLGRRQDDNGEFEDCDDTPDAQGCAQQPVSLSGLLSTLTPLLIIAALYIIIFLILRKSHRRYYAPRTYLGSLREDQRSPDLPSGLLNWFGVFWKIPDTYALKHQSLDAYLFLRFLRVACGICLGGVAITWPILLPINATGGNDQKELEMLSYSNINTTESKGKNRLYAHAIVAWLYYGFILYTILRELIFYINIRQAVLLSPMHSSRMSSRTVLFTSVPAPYQDETRLRAVFGDDKVKRVWIGGESEEVDDLVEERNKVAMTLEKAEVKLIKTATQARTKSGARSVDEKGLHADESADVVARWVPQKDRPTHKTGFLGLVGKKVDSINWGRQELERLIPAVDAAQAKYREGGYKKLAAVFVEFKNQSDAQAAYQVLAHHHALQMAPRYIGITPNQVVWASLSIPWWQKIIRRYVVLGFIFAMILFWAVPVAFVGVLSNIKALREGREWLSFLDDIPDQIMGVITSLLPSILMAILMALVPIVLRLCARISGEPSLARIELFTQNAYFTFQVIHVFLITTFSSGATAVAQQIADDPGSTPELLATNLPKASNFYIAYFLVLGLAVAVGVMTQVAGFAIFSLMYKFLTSTPRSMYQQWATLSAIGWGNTMPTYSLITVICITYGAIAPLVSGFAFVGIGLFYLAYRYNILFVTDTDIDTHGLIYPRAIKQLLVGVYLAEVCLIGLFGASEAFGPFVMMILFLVLTVLFTLTMFSALNPLIHNLPQTLQVAEESMPSGTNPDQEASAATAPPGLVPTPTDQGFGDRLNPVPNLPAKAPNMLVKWLKPWLHANYATLRELVPREGPTDVDAMYPEEVARDAYYPPSVSDKTPLLWIPEDAGGVSKQEIAHTGKVIPITDEKCTIDEQGKLHWDVEGGRPPVWEEKIQY